MWHTISEIFGYMVFLYSAVLITSYIVLIMRSYKAQSNERLFTPDPIAIKYLLKDAPYLPGVSIIAPAYNEEKTIITNVNSLLAIDYPEFEVIIVNDGSTDRMMELLMDTYDMHEVPFIYHEYVKCQPVKTIYKSRDPRFSKLIVVDKVRAGYKADGSNAGINVSSYDYFICTDVDCIVEPLAIYRMIWPVILHSRKVIGVSATMLISNGCKVEDGRLIEANVSWNPLAMFQQLEYLRSFLIGKLGWSCDNMLPNISGGFGFFDKQVVIEAGGYGNASLAEDVDMLMKMIKYMASTNQGYRLVQIPQALCWTEGPGTMKSLYRQRVRWAKGLCQIMRDHLGIIFKPRYKGMGLLVMPYIFLFEFMAPIIELVGFLVSIYLVLTDGINWHTFWLIYLLIYLMSQFITVTVCLFDYTAASARWKREAGNYSHLLMAGLFEPIFYHPLITYFSIVGYVQYIFKINMGWGVMKRKGFNQELQKTKQRENQTIVRTKEQANAANAAGQKNN
ncbi:MAG: glycosyltransferase family 2 protein [Prevotellaceae bacterium]|nr:glycosyltransferase family 2 protein [Candidatus Colivivens caballi]